MPLNRKAASGRLGLGKKGDPGPGGKREYMSPEQLENAYADVAIMLTTHLDRQGQPVGDPLLS